jgi:L-lactate dehydrogenase complex protein LldF
VLLCIAQQQCLCAPCRNVVHPSLRTGCRGYCRGEDTTTRLASGTKLPVRKRDGKGDDVIVTYHDSCQSINCLGLHSEARRIIQEVLGLELREMAQSDVCCGFGGSTSIEHGDVSERIMNNKLNNAESTGATVLVVDNPGCLLHLRGGVDASGRKTRVLHLAQLIAEQLE